MGTTTIFLHRFSVEFGEGKESEAARRTKLSITGNL